MALWCGLDYDEREGHYCAPRIGGGEISRASVRPTMEVPVTDTLALLDRRWMPIPVLRVRPGRSFDLGPTNWARGRIAALAQPDEDGNSHRVTIAFDTTVLQPMQGSAIEYLAPEQKDVGAGHIFMLAWIGPEAVPFAQQRWVSEWVLGDIPPRRRQDARHRRKRGRARDQAAGRSRPLS